MEISEYALLMLDNMQDKGHFVIGKLIGFVGNEEAYDKNNYAIYQDLITEKYIYPSSYEVNEFLDSEEYIKELDCLKWISRKFVGEFEALEALKKLNKDEIFNYGMDVCISKEKKRNRYDSELKKHNNTMKKLKYKKKKRD